MKKATFELVSRVLRATIPDKDEQEEALRLLTPKDGERKDKQLTTKEAAALAGVCPKSIFRWERMGYLHATRATRSRVRWSRRELESFLCATAEA